MKVGSGVGDSEMTSWSWNDDAYLGDVFGSPPGSEMLVSAKIAASIGAKLALIDKPILPVLRGTWKSMPWVEFKSMIFDSLVSFVGGSDHNLNKSILDIDAGLENALTNSLNSISSQLGTLSNQFVKDYMPLTERLRDIVQIASDIQQPSEDQS